MITKSSEPRLWRRFAWLVLVLCIVATIVPIELRPTDPLPPDVDRVLAFALVGSVFAMAYPRRWLVTLVLLICAAFAIEALQYLSPSRHPTLMDAVIKSLGAVSGVVVVRLLLVLRHRLGSRPLP